MWSGSSTYAEWETIQTKSQTDDVDLKSDCTMSSITFKSLKKKRQRQFRSRKTEEDGEDESNPADSAEDEFNAESMAETLELQKLRQRSSGLSHITLASGRKLTKVEEELAADAQDPFKLKTGGTE